jgi:ATP-dependent RNA helicase RhlE
MTFSSLGLSDPILKAIKETGYTTPTPIQAKAIPSVLKGDDVLAAAQTGIMSPKKRTNKKSF